jgi:hypothetical protein
MSSELERPEREVDLLHFKAESESWSSCSVTAVALVNLVLMRINTYILYLCDFGKSH